MPFWPRLDSTLRSHHLDVCAWEPVRVLLASCVLALAVAVGGCAADASEGTRREARAVPMSDQRLDVLPGDAPEPRLPATLTDASGTKVEVADATRIVLIA